MEFGDQRPRICWIPPAVSLDAYETAIDFAKLVRLELDEWQRFSLEAMLGQRADRKWCAFEFGETVARQNGKNTILELREAVGLFEFGDRLITHSAHLFDTSLEAFRRLLDLIEGADELMRRVRRVSRSHGEEGIEIMGPPGHERERATRIRFRTRTKGGGRGFTGDVVILDEDMIISDAFHGALLPTVSARSIQGNPQVIYTGSAVDELIHEHGRVKARLRQRGLDQDPAVAYLEWSADLSLEQAIMPEVARDPRHARAANPALGIRISREHIELEQRSMAPRTFAVERLGVGAWPRTGLDMGDGIDPAKWSALADEHSAPVGSVCFALDVTPNRSHAAISVAGRRGDGLQHAEIIEHKAGTGWVAMRAAALLKKHDAVGMVIDLAGPAASLIPELVNLGLQIRSASAPAGKLITIGAPEHAQACGMLYDSVEQATLRHLGSAELEQAVRSAMRRPLGDRWAWSRKESQADISPLVAITLAVWGSATIPAADLWVSVA